MSLKNYLSQNKEFYIKEEKFSTKNIGFQEAIFTVGNGYSGTRGSYEELPNGSLPGCFIAGIFDHYDSMVNEIVNCPNWTGIKIHVDDDLLSIGDQSILTSKFCSIEDHERILDLKTGLLYRMTKFKDSKGRITKIETLRFASFSNYHLYGTKLLITPENYSTNDNDVHVVVESIIDSDVVNQGETPYNVSDNKKHFPIEIKWEKFSKNRHITLKKNHSKKIDNSKIQGYLEAQTLQTKHTIGYSTLFECQNKENISISFPKNTSLTNNSIFILKGLEKGKTYSFLKLVSIYTSRDVNNDHSKVYESAKNNLEKSNLIGFSQIIKNNNKSWEQKWEDSDFKILGNDEFAKGIRFNIYHLLIAAHQHEEKASIGAKTLTGEGYRGHVFWDMELYMLPFFIYTQPKVAKALLMYRYNCIESAIKNAKIEGYEGSQFPWESADSGVETTPKWTEDMKQRIWTGEQEIHITSDVCFGILHYVRATGDLEFLYKYGLEIIFQSARFWSSRYFHNKKEDRYEIHQVIGPDEFHEHINNSYFTNFLSKWVIKKAIHYFNFLKNNKKELFKNLCEKKVKLSETEIKKWENQVNKVYLPFDEKKQLIEEFEGYFKLENMEITKWTEHGIPIFPNGFCDFNIGKTNLIKQADVVMLFHILGDEFDEDLIEKNFHFYEKKCMHRSSLSPGIHSLMGIKVGDPTKALSYYERSCFVDLYDNQKNAFHGIHAASTGGTWQASVGFSGFKIVKNKNDEDVLSFSPFIPEKWNGIEFKLMWKGDEILIKIYHGKAKFLLKSEKKGIKLDILFQKKPYQLISGNELNIDF